VRYAFHGKIRATGKPIDGIIDALNSEEAFDKLADQGIIGVQTVRAIPMPARSPAMLPGPDQAAGTAQEVSGSASEIVLTQLVDKLTSLVGQVERLVSRGGVQMVAGPARNKGATTQRHPASSAQSAALKAIFETNLDLRKSLEKLNHVTSSFRSSGSSTPSSGTAQAPRDGAVHPAAAVSPVPAALRDSGSSSAAPPPPPRAVHAQPAA
jgi:hypothetical protein